MMEPVYEYAIPAQDGLAIEVRDDQHRRCLPGRSEQFGRFFGNAQLPDILVGSPEVAATPSSYCLVSECNPRDQVQRAACSLRMLEASFIGLVVAFPTIGAATRRWSLVALPLSDSRPSTWG